MIHLPSHVALMARPGVGIQFGTLPSHARILPLRDGATAVAVHGAFTRARSPMDRAELVDHLARCGLGSVVASEIVGELLTAGLMRGTPAGADEVVVLRTGTAAELQVAALGRVGVRRRMVASYRDTWRTLVILPGMLFPPADVQQGLMDRQAVHYPTGVVDGLLVCGPLIVPGHTACLACLDHRYFLRDEGWRGIRAQAVARPTADDAGLVHALSWHVANLVAEHVVPWWSGDRDPRAIPRVLRERRLIDIATGEIHREEARADRRCYSCHSVRVLQR